MDTKHLLDIAAMPCHDGIVELQLRPGHVDWLPLGRERMVSMLRDGDALMVYADGVDDRHIDLQAGAIRDDFDFGPVVMIRHDVFRHCTRALDQDLHGAGFYALRLMIQRLGTILHIPEALYTFDSSASSGGQFDYVDPRNASVQAEMEQVATEHLSSIGALISRQNVRTVNVDEGFFPVEVSVVIPVRNRVATIRDAVLSALSQSLDCTMNVLVVDNHSTDGTSEVLAELASTHPNLKVIVPESRHLGIGGCWNRAIDDAACGRFAVQLDSDDIYSGADTLQRITDTFRRERCAMVVGSYRLTDFDLNTIPPGLIDHKEWTDHNGRNNLLRVNGMGAPRAFLTRIVRKLHFPDVSYGEDYAMALRLSRSYHIGRIYDELYLCRRWQGNSDAQLDRATLNRYNSYKDFLRTAEINARIRANSQP